MTRELSAQVVSVGSAKPGSPVESQHHQVSPRQPGGRQRVPHGASRGVGEQVPASARRAILCEHERPSHRSVALRAVGACGTGTHGLRRGLRSVALRAEGQTIPKPRPGSFGRVLGTSENHSSLSYSTTKFAGARDRHKSSISSRSVLVRTVASRTSIAG